MNLANKLTMARILLVPLFMFVLLVDLIPYREYLAAAIFIVAASTDGLDGYIARARKQETRLGRLLDPLADKLLVSAALISLVELNLVPAWIAMVIIGREFAVTGLRALVAAEGMIVSANKLGKVKTITQIVAIVAVLIHDFPFSFIGFPFGQIAIYGAVLFTIWSGVNYFYQARKVLKAQS